MKTDDQVMKTHDHVEMIKRRHLWSYWPPTLPLEHRCERSADGMLRCAYMLDVDGEPTYRVRFGNIFAGNLLNNSYQDFDSAEAIVSAGWQVDPLRPRCSARAVRI
jgi:hypothetical protein